MPAPRRPPGRKHRVKADDPAYAHLPLIVSDEHGTITVLRGEVDIDRLDEEQRGWLQFYAGNEHLVTSNRRGKLSCLRVGALAANDPGPAWERWRQPDFDFASNWADVRAELHRALAEVDALEADGWKLIRTFPDDVGGGHRIIDTRHPDVTE